MYTYYVHLDWTKLYPMELIISSGHSCLNPMSFLSSSCPHKNMALRVLLLPMGSDIAALVSEAQRP